MLSTVNLMSLKNSFFFHSFNLNMHQIYSIGNNFILNSINLVNSSCLWTLGLLWYSDYLSVSFCYVSTNWEQLNLGEENKQTTITITTKTKTNKGLFNRHQIAWLIFGIWYLLNIQSDLCAWHNSPLINPHRIDTERQ